MNGLKINPCTKPEDSFLILSRLLLLSASLKIKKQYLVMYSISTFHHSKDKKKAAIKAENKIESFYLFFCVILLSHYLENLMNFRDCRECGWFLTKGYFFEKKNHLFLIKHFIFKD